MSARQTILNQVMRFADPADMDVGNWDICTDNILTALDAAGFAVVPKEMTDAHYMDAHTNYPYCVAAHPEERGTCQEKTKALYTAAITAAKETP